MNNRKDTHPRKSLIHLRAAADGHRARIHKAGNFDRVSPALWNRYLAAINAHDLEQWRRGRAA